jgi:hypothetical protein
LFVTTLNPIPTVGREIRGIRLEEGGRLVTKVHTFMHRTRTKFDCFRVEMYGTTASSSARQKAGTVAAVCGFAAVVAVAGAVGFSATSTLYAPVTVTPTTFVRTAAHPQLSAPTHTSTSSAQYAATAAVHASEAAKGSGSDFWSAAIAVSGIAAVVASLLWNKPTASLNPLPISMAAASGERLVWIPGAKAPAHLTGQYPGDRGFDPLGFSKDPKTFERMRVAEVFHGRLAMLGVVGSLAPEIFFHRESWHAAAEAVDINKAGTIALQIIAPLEYWRGNGGFSWAGGEAGDRSYPGFDPLGITTEDTKLREVKNGRLAMTAMLGFEVQYHVTGTGPLQNLSAHFNDPLGANILTSFGAGSVAMFAAAGEKSERPLWFPGGYAPAYLKGEFPGDRGFDPAGLAADPKQFAFYRLAEVFHGRLAMLAIVGAVTQEYLGKGAWYEGPANAGVGVSQVATAVLVSGFPEIFRGLGGFGKQTNDKSYPGFDPLGLTTAYTKEAEIKNGRLALVGMLGLEVQRNVTGKSPITNLVQHFKDPVDFNFVSTLVGSQSVAMFATAGHKEGLWLPNTKPPAHLTGEFPGDRGFDPLSLSADPTTYARMRAAEVFNGRLAMLGVAGALAPEILGKGAWFELGDALKGEPNGFLFMALVAPVEYWRGNGGFGWEKGTTDRIYPGFDPAKLSGDRNKTAEIKNGRLAMLAILGFEAQYHLTGASPLANLAAHMADPFKVNITTNIPSIGMF